jgi:hypothetical protein
MSWGHVRPRPLACTAWAGSALPEVHQARRVSARLYPFHSRRASAPSAETNSPNAEQVARTGAGITLLPSSRRRANSS